jgi:uncharacterized protein YerC
MKDICFECGSNNQIEYHHVVPEVMGGTKTIPLCVICHSKVHGKDLLKLRELARIGTQKARANGVVFGRKVGSKESIEVWMAKPNIIQITNLLKDRHSIRNIAKIIGCSTKTVQKVKNKIGQ